MVRWNLHEVNIHSDLCFYSHAHFIPKLFVFKDWIELAIDIFIDVVNLRRCSFHCSIFILNQSYNGFSLFKNAIDVWVVFVDG